MKEFHETFGKAIEMNWALSMRQNTFRIHEFAVLDAKSWEINATSFQSSLILNSTFLGEVSLCRLLSAKRVLNELNFSLFFFPLPPESQMPKCGDIHTNFRFCYQRGLHHAFSSFFHMKAFMETFQTTYDALNGLPFHKDGMVENSHNHATQLLPIYQIFIVCIVRSR